MSTAIVLVGYRASGKDEFSTYCTTTYRMPSVRFSTVIGDMAVELGLMTREEFNQKAAFQRAAEEIRSRYGVEGYTRRAVQEVRGKDATINGTRKPLEVVTMRKELERVVLVAIDADRSLRLQRALQLGIVTSEEDFARQEQHPAEAHIGEIMAGADVRLTNNDCVSDYHRAIDDLLRNLGVPGKPL